MNGDNFYIGAYWAGRAESSERCAERSAHMLEGLASASDQYSHWYIQGSSRAGALREKIMLGDADALRDRFVASRRVGDTDTVGYRLSAWNGRDPGVSLSVLCGAVPRTPHVLNTAVLTLGAEDDAPELLRPDVAEATLRALVDAWTPDWATVSSYAVRKAQAAPPRSPVLGWMTVVRRTTRVADLPVEGEYSVLRLPGGPTSVTADAVTTAREVHGSGSAFRVRAGGLKRSRPALQALYAFSGVFAVDGLVLGFFWL